jgi:hypothetical protein
MSDKEDAIRYRKLLDMQTMRAAEFIEEHGTIGLDKALDNYKTKFTNEKTLRKFLGYTRKKS